MLRYLVVINGTDPMGGDQFSNKRTAISHARAEAARYGRRVQVMDFAHPDLKGIEYARCIFRA
jgi:hypothetical protein